MSGLIARLRGAWGRSIRTRIRAALLAVTLATLGLSTLLSAVVDLKLLRDHMLRDLEVLAAVVGENCTAALVFDDPGTAERHLATLEREYQIRAAVLHDADGRPFARWAPAIDADVLAGPLGRLLTPRVTIVHPIDFDGRTLGRLELSVVLDELWRQLRTYGLFGVIAMLATLGLALALALGLERRIAGPILELAGRSRRLSERADPGERLPDPSAGAEISTLVAGFNAVLAGLAEREGSLSRKTRALDQANAKLRELALDLALLEEREKARLAAELHDGPMQTLALAQVQIDSAAGLPDAESAAQLQAGVELLREANAELRTVQFDLSPPVLARGGLRAGLAWLAERARKRFGIDLVLVAPEAQPELDQAHCVLAFQCARELVNNLAKHARARRGTIHIGQAEGCLELRIADDGRGFAAAHRDGDSRGGGYGLQGVCERLALVDGRLALEDLRPGAQVWLWIPLASVPKTGAAASRTAGESTGSARFRTRDKP